MKKVSGLGYRTLGVRFVWFRVWAPSAICSIGKCTRPCLRVLRSGFMGLGFAFGVECLGFGLWSGFWALGFGERARIHGLGFRVLGLAFWVWGIGFEV